MTVGLRTVDDDDYINIGRYEGLQFMRECLIEASIACLERRVEKLDRAKTVKKERKRLRLRKGKLKSNSNNINNNGPQSRKKFKSKKQMQKLRSSLHDCIYDMKSWMRGSKYQELLNLRINYEREPKISSQQMSNLISVGLVGIVWWTFHSDADNLFSLGQITDIVSSFEKVIKFVKENYLANNTKRWVKTVLDFFKKALEKNK